jgi:hypothetical protein
VAAATLTAALFAVGDAATASVLAQDTLQRCRRALGRDHRVTRYLARAVGTAPSHAR